MKKAASVAFKIYLFICKYKLVSSSQGAIGAGSGFARHPKIGLDSSLEPDRVELF